MHSNLLMTEDREVSEKSGMLSPAVVRWSAGGAIIFAAIALVFGPAVSEDVDSAPPVDAPEDGRFPEYSGSEFALSELQHAAAVDLGDRPLVPPVAANPFSYSGTDDDRGKAAECLAYAAWYEAGNDPVGQRAVMQTVINRVNHSAYPNSVCGVVFEGSHLSTGCQFTFTCDGSIAARRPSAPALASARDRAEEALRGKVDQSIGTATHYHADYVYPYWASGLDRVAVVGPHIFYKFRGRSGSLRSRARLDGEAGFTRLAARIPQRRIRPDDTSGLAASSSHLGMEAGAEAASEEKVRPVAPGAFYIGLGDSNAAGRWAISALKTCQGRSSCQVFGYENDGAAIHNRRAALSDRQRPLFLFVRDQTSGMDVALWDCQRVSRTDPSQCLPSSAGALSKLMRERG
ncbi:cell wall hydrolase [Qipengyuania sp. G39]|uniref:Cell wall hydrolase n=1 Tax=Qipengyuania profundimaris TaxID=3067652 RepID=A0ABT9HP69_9SPHN|nr:cell wall hydrolase [Qipengyuania sp. G39]MDP4574939.1 cell wall hydrolase [Qipengyuania sp. G39]